MWNLLKWTLPINCLSFTKFELTQSFIKTYCLKDSRRKTCSKTIFLLTILYFFLNFDLSLYITTFVFSCLAVFCFIQNKLGKIKRTEFTAWYQDLQLLSNVNFLMSISIFYHLKKLAWFSLTNSNVQKGKNMKNIDYKFYFTKLWIFRAHTLLE